MKTKKIVKKALRNCMQIVAIISIFIVVILINQKKDETKIAKQYENTKRIIMTENITESTETTENSEFKREEVQVTSRHSTSRSRKNIEDTQIELEKEAEENNYTKIEDITISKDMDLTVRTGLSKEDFKTLISNVKYDTSKFFYNNSDLIYDLCEEYQINEIFLCGLISAESGWDIAYNHRRTHNYISLMTKNGLIQYSSEEQGLTVAAKTLCNNYLTEGGCFYYGKTLSGVKTRFCPSSNTWVNLVYGRMEQIVNCR